MRHSTMEAATTAPNTSVLSSTAHPTPLNKITDVDGYACSLWPLHPDDVSPLQWWRTMPVDHLGDAQHLLLRATLQNISAIKGREWLAGLRDNAALCVAAALGALPIIEISLKIDLAMSALTVSALGGDAGSVLVLSHILRRVPLDHPFARELSVSWLVLNLRRALEAKAIAKARATEAHRTPANRDAIDHRAAFYSGDFS